MQFNSFTYLAFLIAAVTVFWLLPSRFRRSFVLVASLAFYASWNFAFVLVPLAVCGFVYLIGKWMTGRLQVARVAMWTGIICLVAVLTFFKYRNFLLANISLLDGHSFSKLKPLEALALPLGISFYTFEAIGYLVDLRQKRLASLSFIDLCLFLMFWPNITAGPIVRARELVPQLKFSAQFEPRFVFDGLDRLMWGLVQKTVIANLLGIWVDRGFGSNSRLTFSSIDCWCLTIAFGLQIYFDFAGYSNMAIGSARLIGVTLPENFHYPYHAVSPPEFWSRWHMTLSRWIRDYLFFPVNAKFFGAPAPLYASLIGIMALVGLWHGAGWNYILWGAMHGVYLVLFRIYERATRMHQTYAKSRATALAWRLFTLLAVFAAWVPFRCSSLQRAGTFLARMFGHFTAGFAFDSAFYVFTGAAAVFCIVEPYFARLVRDEEETSSAERLAWSRILVRPLAYSCCLVLFMLFDVLDGQFIYTQF